MSGREHLSNDVLLDAMYGVAGEDAAEHLRACPACAERLSEWRQRRAGAEESAGIPDEFLAAQRRKIYQRLEQPPRKHWWWAPALGAACALALGIFVYQPVNHSAPRAQPVVNSEASDAQLFSDVYSLEQTLEPSATAAARALFEEQAQ